MFSLNIIYLFLFFLFFYFYFYFYLALIFKLISRLLLNIVKISSYRHISVQGEGAWRQAGSGYKQAHQWATNYFLVRMVVPGTKPVENPWLRQMLCSTQQARMIWQTFSGSYSSVPPNASKHRHLPRSTDHARACAVLKWAS